MHTRQSRKETNTNAYLRQTLNKFASKFISSYMILKKSKHPLYFYLGQKQAHDATLKH